MSTLWTREVKSVCVLRLFLFDEQLKALSGSVYIGHTNTDMDSIGSAIGCAELFGGKATRATENLNNEIRTCLKYWGLDQPPMFNSLPNRGSDARVCLVDHQQTTQFADGVLEQNVVGVIDHHSLKNQTVCTAGPIYIDIRPWGSACTIIACEFFQMRRWPSKPVAGMLLSGILSDTLNLKSPTTTDSDRVMVAALSQVAEVPDIGSLATMQFKAKSAEVSICCCFLLHATPRMNRKWDTMLLQLGMMTDTEIVVGDHKVFKFQCGGTLRWYFFITICWQTSLVSRFTVWYTADDPEFSVGFGVCECVTEVNTGFEIMLGPQ